MGGWTRKHWVVVALMLVGVAIRTREINQPIVRFHPTRHYRSAVLARACYYDHASGIPEAARAVADANRVMQPVGEPPLLEWLACGAYLATGHEDITVPRVITVLVWVSGAVPLLLIATRLASPAAALLGVALYLFLPYGIVASRNFQPDGLMTVASLWAIVALLRYHDDPRESRWLAAAVLVGGAGVIKPMSVFLTAPVTFAVSTSTGHRRDPVRLRLARAGVLMVGGMLLPALYYGSSAITGNLVRDQMRMRFEPHLLTTAFFWKGLANMASRVETWPLLLLTAAAAIFGSERLARWILASLLAGYLAFAIAFTYHMPTHDYYHLPYIAVVAIGIAVLAARLELRIAESVRRPLAVALALAIAVAGSIAAWPRLHSEGTQRLARIYQEIGELAQHDTRALFLDTEYGYALMYHGEISGDSWPNRDDLAAEAIDGRPAVDAEARFVRDYADWAPNYFIATDLSSFDAEPDLAAMLERHAVPVRITSDYRVYRFTR